MTLFILIIFFAISIAIGIFVSRKEDAEGFMIANRQLRSFESVMTLSGSFVGAMVLLVYTAFVYTFGISALWIFIGYFIGFVVFSFFAVYLKRFASGKGFLTLADYFRYRFGKTTARLVIIVLFIWYFGQLTAQFIGGGKVLSELTGFDYRVSAVIMCLVILTYLLLGGLKSVVKTDVFQFLVLGLILFLMVFTLRTGIKVPVTHFNPFNAGATNIVAFLLLGLLGPFATQDYWQRIFAMKDEKVVKKSFIISGVLVLLVSVILTYVGLVARTKFAGIDPDMAVLYSFTKLVPEFMKGFVAVSFFAAILSTADTYLFILAVNVANDLRDKEEKDLKKELRLTRIALLVIGFSALGLSLAYSNLVNISIIFKAIGMIVAPLVLIVWIGKGNSKAINITIILSTVIVAILTFFGFIKPELGFVSMIGGFIFYFLASIVLKIFAGKQTIK